ncbi:MAG: DUF3006 domain-containing protein [Clostridia bacterium]|nr:DUF3006 domain-containing protein [Clostridia bacterium]
MQIENDNFKITNEENNLENFIQSILKELNLMEETLVVDRIEENIAVCENRKSGKIIEIDISKLPKGIKEGNVLKYEKGIYKIDIEEQKKIEERIKEKMKNIWNN